MVTIAAVRLPKDLASELGHGLDVAAVPESTFPRPRPNEPLRHGCSQLPLVFVKVPAEVWVEQPYGVKYPLADGLVTARR